jgi:hypothetical protein
LSRLWSLGHLLSGPAVAPVTRSTCVCSYALSEIVSNFIYRVPISCHLGETESWYILLRSASPHCSTLVAGLPTFQTSHQIITISSDIFSQSRLIVCATCSCSHTLPYGRLCKGSRGQSSCMLEPELSSQRKAAHQSSVTVVLELW